MTSKINSMNSRRSRPSHDEFLSPLVYQAHESGRVLGYLNVGRCVR